MIEFNSICGNKILALVDNGKLSQVRLEKVPGTMMYQVIYKGRIIRTVSGLKAAKKIGEKVYRDQKAKAKAK